MTKISQYYMKNNSATNKNIKRSNTTRKTTQRRTKVKKVYIPKWKILVMCFSIILVCLGLLLITNIIDSRQRDIETQNQKEVVEDKKVDNGDRVVAEKNVDSGDRVVAETKTVSKQPPVSETKNKPVVHEQVSEPVKTVTTTTVVTKSLTNNSTDTPKIPPIQSFDFPKAVNNAQLVFLFDDGGQSLSQLESFLNLPFPITVAVLPKLKYSKECAEKIRKSGNELMLHQPMQAINLSVNPGPGAITPEMTAEEIIKTITENINEIGPIAGINNHEGSAITADETKMKTVMNLTNNYGIFFLDSRTNKDTTVPAICKELGYSYFERNGNFLDNTKTRDNALSMIRKNLDIANKNGVVIMIGHIWSADYLPQLLKDIYPELQAKGYKITTVSKSKGRK